MNKKTLIVCLAVVALLAAGLWLFHKPMTPQQRQEAWQANLQRQKETPFQDGTFTPRGGEPVALQYRVFNPAIDLNQLREEPPNWRDDPVDSFLRQRYVIYFDPEPTYEKYSESFVDGMDAVNEIVNKIPQFKNDPNDFFQKSRRGSDAYKEQKLIGEILIDGVHILVHVNVFKSGVSMSRGAVFAKTADGKFYAHPKLQRENKLLDALAQDRYSIVFNHFPEYSNNKFMDKK